VKVPAEAGGSIGRLVVMGGLYTWSRYSHPSSIAQAERFARTMVRDDQVQVTPDIAKKRTELTNSLVTHPLAKVVSGNKRVKVVVQ
jgi:hypothetical protein